MKTSLICLLLLATVACAAPQAGEMPGEKRVGMADMREKMAGKRKERAEQKRKEPQNAVAAAKSDGEAESRVYDYCYGYCSSFDGKIGCLRDYCYDPYEIISYDPNTDCFCCDELYYFYLCF